MIVSNPPGPVSSTQPYLIASAVNIDGNSLATTTLNWNNGASAANTLPMYARIVRRTGTITLLVASLRLNSNIIQPITAIQSALLGSGNDPVIYPLSSLVSVTTVPIAGNWDLVVNTINGSSTTIDVSIYGLKIA